MSANDAVDSGIPVPRLATVQPLHDFVLRVKWAEGARAGREDFVDVSPAIFSYKVYRPLRDENLFLTGILVEDGDAVAWGDTEDLMMSADTIQSLAQESWTPKEFADFLIRNRLTQEAAAALLGRSRRQIATYATKGPIPRVIALACYGFESLRRDRFLQGTGGIGAQPPKVHSGSPPDPTDRATPRQRVLP
ncbi:hypothetical protein [Bradyrhizobium sp.]|uniref:hypothetical protein n=1 Tax=Bradyrhizobium sp. TaxID=376 RepID=UPI002DDDA6E2|nr:hypothetical protein [Bradyrhizobium sp.]HEV2154593.1 hypothetical protein [Bradyrhizobium sp.]